MAQTKRGSSGFKERAAAVRVAHAELAKNQPGFKDLAPKQQFKETQAHVRKQGNRWYGWPGDRGE